MPITGEGGAVNGINCVRMWAVGAEAFPAEGWCSASDGSPIRIPGNTDYHGVYLAYGVEPTVLPGSLFRLIGSSRAGYGVDTQANGAIVDRSIIDWDLSDPQNPKLISYQNFFSQAAESLLLGAYAATDSSTPNPPAPFNLGIAFDSVAFDETEKMRLILESNNAERADASTDGKVYRAAGNIDASFEATVLIDNPADLPAKNTVVEVAMETEEALAAYWQLKWCLITLAQPIMHIEGSGGRPEYWRAVVKGKFTGYNSGVKGTIVTPGGTVWWPT